MCSTSRLTAVLAHELTHLAHRDALVMTVAAAPGIWVLRGLRGMWDQGDSVVQGIVALAVRPSVRMDRASVRAARAAALARP
jgi:Zn-dependent protease with chaperone function